MRGPIPDKPRNRPTVPEVREMIERFYAKPGNDSGGVLHAALDDGNLRNVYLKAYQKSKCVQTDRDAMAIVEALLAMTSTQRRKVYSTFGRSGYCMAEQTHDHPLNEVR